VSAVENLRDNIRAVTPQEVAHYEEHGWVMLRGLFTRELVAEMLEGAKVALEDGAKEFGASRARGLLSTEGVEPFRTIAFSPEMARVATALINRARLSDIEVPVQFHADSVWMKGPGASGTPFHQDEPMRPGDRAGVFNLWLALDDVAPEMGGLRFLSGVHREGSLGITLHDGPPDSVRAAAAADETLEEEVDARGILNHFPKLENLYEWSPPFDYAAGDATVHHGWMIHGGPKNTAERERWAYIVEYLPADTRFFFDGDKRLISGMDQRELPVESNPVLRTEADLS
jgi:hypothetical protein